MLVNILQNALEALEGQADARIELVVEAGTETVRMTLRDNGPGIAQDVADRLFTPFATSRPDWGLASSFPRTSSRTSAAPFNSSPPSAEPASPSY
ncbi:ATP-binding protein [Novosphingobium resinovorum]